MKVMDVIQLLEKEGTWIRSDFKTRDHQMCIRDRFYVPVPPVSELRKS